MIPEATSAEEAADKAVLPSVLRRGCRQASWIQQLCDSSCASATRPPSSQHTLKTGEKGSCKVVFPLYNLNSSFLLSTENVQCFFY